jgi:transposase
MLADELDYVLGVDTRRDEHVVAVVTAPAGAVVAGKTARANARGYRDLLGLAARHAPGRRVWAIEGTGSYGVGLARYLAERGETVLEVSRTHRGPNGGCAARTTPSTPPAPRERHSPARRSHCRGPASGGKRCGCCWSRAEAPSTSAAKRSASCVP